MSRANLASTIAATSTLVLALLLSRARSRLSNLAARCESIERALQSSQRALAVMNRAQRTLDVCSVPQLQEGASPGEGWQRCMAALRAIESGYARFEKDGAKSTLVSNFMESRPQPQKAEVDALLARHTRRCFPDLVEILSTSPALVLLILDAPTCATVRSLLEALPELSGHGSRIVIPQADPAHYIRQLRGHSSGEEDGMASDEPAPLATMLHVRNERLDQWLSSNRRCVGLRVPVAFFDFECSIYGRPKVHFHPLRDLQLFFRLGYAASPTCLLGVTLSFRAPHESRYAKSDAPLLTPSDLEGFIDGEARAAGMQSTLVETVAYGLSFFLFELRTLG